VCYEYNKIKNDTEKDKEDNYEKRRNLREEMDIIEFGPNYMIDYLTNDMEGTTYENLAVENTNKTARLDLPDDRALIEEYFKCLGLANECVVEDDNSFSGNSPDDIELVKSCKDQGWEPIKSDPSANNFKRLKMGGKAEGKVINYEVLNVNEFSSDRKRMSIIVVDGDNIKMYMKGADSEMERRLSKTGNSDAFIDQAKNYIKYFSNMGYRTLMVGMKMMSKEELNLYLEGVREAGMLSSEAKQIKMDMLNDVVERDIFLLGATIVEDKLQDMVPETIRDLRLAGIRVWMLTGDKLTTGKNIGIIIIKIGLSCNLISHQMKTFEVCGENGDRLEKLIKEFNEYKPKENEQFGILIDAVALTVLLADADQTKSFLEISHNAASVICCRVSPLQKSEVVKVMKEFDPDAVTLAIGDGGNDVSMIMEAHIGTN
jgi:magnesium-transporting ATPase (P-type)